MKLKDDKNSNKISPQVMAASIGVVLVFFLILVVVLVFNKEKFHPAKQNHPGENAGISETKIQAEAEDTSGIEHPEDLDFWELYPKDQPLLVEETKEPDNKKEEQPQAAEEKDPMDDPSTDGKHTLVIDRNGKEEWFLINQYLPKNSYDITNLVLKSAQMEYFIGGEKVSFWGIDVQKSQDYIDFNAVRKAGVDFVMIRTGIRGYGTGQLSLDDYFYDNIKRAFDAGLSVGLYFTSQAITEEEAVEEAEFVLEALGDYHPDYPIAIDMGFVDNDKARIEALTRAEKTAVTKAFLDRVSEEGFTGMIYADKEWLMKEIDMSKLTGYDVWLRQKADVFDYPYKFSMWQYGCDALDGVAGPVNMNISFVNYSEK